MVPATGFLITHIQADSCLAHSCNSSQLTTYCFTASLCTFTALHNSYCGTYLRLQNDVEMEFLHLKFGKKTYIAKNYKHLHGGLAMTTKTNPKFRKILYQKILNWDCTTKTLSRISLYFLGIDKNYTRVC